MKQVYTSFCFSTDISTSLLNTHIAFLVHLSAINTYCFAAISCKVHLENNLGIIFDSFVSSYILMSPAATSISVVISSGPEDLFNGILLNACSMWCERHSNNITEHWLSDFPALGYWQDLMTKDFYEMFSSGNKFVYITI